MHRRNSSSPWRSAGTCNPICRVATAQSWLHSPGCMLAPWHGGKCSARRAKLELQTRQPSVPTATIAEAVAQHGSHGRKQRALRHRQSYPIKSAAVRPRVGAVPLGPTGSPRSLACRGIGHLRAIHRCSCQTLRATGTARPRARWRIERRWAGVRHRPFSPQSSAHGRHCGP